MELTSFIVVFMCTWWVILYITLPFSIKPINKNNKGYADSAPEKPQLLKKIFITTIIALIITFLIIKILNTGYFSDLIKFEAI